MGTKSYEKERRSGMKEIKENHCRVNYPRLLLFFPCRYPQDVIEYRLNKSKLY